MAGPLSSYFSPILRYPAASLYHLANGTIQLRSHCRFMINVASEGTDMLAAMGVSVLMGSSFRKL
jgi:hypothetical protein